MTMVALQHIEDASTELKTALASLNRAANHLGQEHYLTHSNIREAFHDTQRSIVSLDNELRRRIQAGELD